LNPIAVNRVASNAITSSENTTDLPLSDIHSYGHLVLVTTDGSITINEGDDNDTGIEAANNILINQMVYQT
jgi:hypothetical protein